MENWDREYIIVVDSLGDGRFAKFIEINDFSDRVLYFNSDVNLGSAGNLHKRLIWATELDVEFVLALNHDAVVTHAVYLELVRTAQKLPKFGALYPLRFLSGKNIYDISGKSYYSIKASGPKTKPSDELIEVYWSSSNGALYSTEPLSEINRISPDSSLWMGWEDYFYGLQLNKAGYGQWIVSSAETIDHYEYKSLNTPLGERVVSDKPIWYCYYDSRNLLLGSFYRVRSPVLIIFVMIRIFLGLLLIPLKFKSETFLAVRFYLTGVRDGIKNISGKWTLP